MMKADNSTVNRGTHIAMAGLLQSFYSRGSDLHPTHCPEE
jgi:hypothetical protein